MEAGDKKNAILIALKEFPEKSQRDIATQVGCSVGHVNKIKNEVFSSEHLSHNSPTRARMRG